MLNRLQVSYRKLKSPIKFFNVNLKFKLLFQKVTLLIRVKANNFSWNLFPIFFINRVKNINTSLNDGQQYLYLILYSVCNIIYLYIADNKIMNFMSPGRKKKTSNIR